MEAGGLDKGQVMKTAAQATGHSLRSVIAHWSLVIRHWSLVIGHSSLVIGHSSFVIRDPVPGTGYELQIGKGLAKDEKGAKGPEALNKRHPVAGAPSHEGRGVESCGCECQRVEAGVLDKGQVMKTAPGHRSFPPLPSLVTRHSSFVIRHSSLVIRHSSFVIPARRLALRIPGEPACREYLPALCPLIAF